MLKDKHVEKTLIHWKRADERLAEVEQLVGRGRLATALGALNSAQLQLDQAKENLREAIVARAVDQEEGRSEPTPSPQTKMEDPRATGLEADL